MGNCNSYHPVYQKCKSCYGKWSHDGKKFKSCKCTKGLDGTCSGGKCASWQTQTPGLYDVQYNNWLAANPKPVEPKFVPFPEITAGDFVCTQCSQCQDFSNINASNLNIDDADQLMNCIGKMETALEEQEKTAAKEIAMAKDNEETERLLREKLAAQKSEEAFPMGLVLLVIVFLVILGLIIAIKRSRGGTQYTSPYTRPQYTQTPYTQPVYQQPQYTQPVYPQPAYTYTQP